MNVLKSAFFQITTTFSIRIVGLVIIWALYQLFTLDEIGEYFYLLSCFASFISIQNIGGSKPVIRNYQAGDFESVSALINTKILISLLFSCVLYFICISTTRIGSVPAIMLSVALIASAITPDWLAMAKTDFKRLSYVQFVSQGTVCFILLLATFSDESISVTTHQLLLSVTLLIGVTVIAGKRYFAFIRPRIGLINLTYFVKNSVLIVISVYMASLVMVDLFIAKHILSAEALGVYAGLVRYSQFNYGILLMLNGVFFSFAKNYTGDLNSERERVVKIVRIVSTLTLLCLAYPYIKFIMGINIISNEILYAAIATALGAWFMPSFFKTISKIEVNSADICFCRLIKYLLIASLFALLILFFLLRFFVEQQYALVLLTFWSAVKWKIFTHIIGKANVSSNV